MGVRDVRFCFNKFNALFNVGFGLRKLLRKKYGTQSLVYVCIGLELLKLLPR